MEQYRNNLFLAASGVAYLVERSVELVGIDGLVIDDPHDGHRPAHTGLLRTNIQIVENFCNLDQLPPIGFYFVAAPPKFERTTVFPARTYAFFVP